MIMEFKCGDRVVLIQDVRQDLYTGHKGTIFRIDRDSVSVEWDNFNNGWGDDEITSGKSSGWCVQKYEVKLLFTGNWKEYFER